MAQQAEWEGGRPALRQYTLANFRDLPQVRALPEAAVEEMEVVGRVLPFKANNYVAEQLVDWAAAPGDPMYVLTFPQRGMLRPAHFDRMAALVRGGAGRAECEAAANEIRTELNPHPAGQMELNVPSLADGTRLPGMQHKYRETCLFFPSQGQTCHAYCSFCFRWPQFVGMEGMRFAMGEAELLVRYLREHPEVTDVLFTGGDPMVMGARVFRAYVDALLGADLPGLRTIRIGTKMLSYWPYKVLTDADAEETLRTLRDVASSGLHLSLMAHFNHPRELSTPAARAAVARIRETGAQIRTQSPLLARINDDAGTWARMWQEQVSLGCVPYYMFVVRDTGAQHYFGVPLARAHRIFRDAYSSVGGLAKTVRGPSMSAGPGKVVVDGEAEAGGGRALVLRFLQARNPDWVGRPFLAEYDESASWLDDLRPAGGGRFFFEAEFEAMRGAARPAPGGAGRAEAAPAGKNS